MFLPSSQKENDEVWSILERKGLLGYEAAWIRISNSDNTGSWRDIENNALVNLTNWANKEPKSYHSRAYTASDRKWYSSYGDSRKNIICELP